MRDKWRIGAERDCHAHFGLKYHPITGGRSIHDWEGWGFTREDAAFVVKCLNERDKARAESAAGESDG